jgi:hypothetical protein
MHRDLIVFDDSQILLQVWCVRVGVQQNNAINSFVRVVKWKFSGKIGKFFEKYFRNTMEWKN